MSMREKNINLYNRLISVSPGEFLPIRAYEKTCWLFTSDIKNNPSKFNIQVGLFFSNNKELKRPCSHP